MTTHDENLFLALGRLEGKVDSLLALQKSQEEQLRTHDERIRHLESSKSFMMGASAIIGGCVSLIANFFLKGQ